MNHFPKVTKALLVTAFISALTACKITPNHTNDVYGNQKNNLREECLRNLKWRQQQNLNGLFDDDASDGDRLVSAIIFSNTNEAEERLKCESLGRRNYSLEGVPEKPKSKKQNIVGEL
jgi:hypothetical protein